MSSSDVPARRPLQAVRMTVGAMAAASVFITLIMYSVAPHDAAPPLLAVGIVVVVGIVAAVLILQLGFRTPSATTLGDTLGDVDTEMKLFTSLAFTRASLAEVPVFVAVVLGIAMEPSSWYTVVVGGVVSVLLAGLSWPGERTVRRIADSLERDGGRSWLRTQLS